jgi:hypothetical protein
MKNGPRRHTITLKNGSISIIEYPDDKVTVEMYEVKPLVVLVNDGIPGVIGPDLSFDMVQLSKEEKVRAYDSSRYHE